MSGVSGIDTSVAHPARVYDYWLGGKDNFAADREAGELILQAYPQLVHAVRSNRAFLTRVVRFLAREAGIRQFLDIGTGMPTANNTHEVAQAIASDSRIVYVDDDQVVLLHAQAMLTSSADGACDYIHADLRDTDQVLEATAKTLDFSQPIALMLLGVLHLIPEKDDPYALVGHIVDALPAGSYLVISREGPAPAAALRVQRRRGSRRLFRAIDTQPLSEASNRALVDPMLFRVAYSTGMRLSGALGLELRDFDPARATLEVRDGKNRENRTLPVTARLTATLDTYITAAHPQPGPCCKLSHTGDPSRPPDKSTAYNRFRRYLADADIPHFPGGPHIHSLRHGFAVANLRRWASAGADLAVMLPYLSAYMGHADLRGTQYYLRLTADAYPEVAAMTAARFGYVIPGPPGPQGPRR